MTKKVFRKYLEIKSIKEINKFVKPDPNFLVELVAPSNFQLNRFLYKEIGKKYHWTDRLVWSNEKWISYVSSKQLYTFVLKNNENLVGYFELIFHQDKNEVEIAYFGLLEEYFGKKLGGYLLTEALKKSFYIRNVERVWCHTCSYDHKHGIKNYLSRGMSIFKTEIINL